MNKHEMDKHEMGAHAARRISRRERFLRIYRSVVVLRRELYLHHEVRLELSAR